MVHTENVLNSVSKTKVSGYNGPTDNQGIGSNNGTWDGTSQPETAKDNNGFNLWGDED